MAINYTDLFEDVGEYVEAINELYTFAATTLVARETEIEAQLMANTRQDLIGGIIAGYDSVCQSVVSLIQTICTEAENRLSHESTVLVFLPGVSAESRFTDVWKLVYRDMLQTATPVTVDASVVTLGASAANASNAGNAVLFRDKVLDGYENPASGFPSNRYYAYDLANACWPGENPSYAGTSSELCATSETLTLECITDASNGSEDSEQFQISGGFVERMPYDYKYLGSGVGSTLSVVNGESLLVGGEFEDWTSDGETVPSYSPDDWDVDSGTIVDNIRRGSTSYRGTYCLQLKGKTGAATIKISQDMTSLTPLKRYFVGCWVKGEASTLAGTLTLQMEGTGYTAGANEKIALGFAALSAMTSFAAQGFWFTAPPIIPDDFELVIKTTGTLTNLKSVYVDGLVLANPTWHGGLALAMLAGDTPSIIGDRYTVSVANDGAGAFQEFFRRWFRIQLPSATSGETVADTLATD